ncbi:MAG: carboxypeptidase-like regulatory domain-containing protein, partial [Myxococcota bacterium]|nr:carboxypeptidase-like regulatory domain-containing protein [Myxococcota bacterium]
MSPSALPSPHPSTQHASWPLNALCLALLFAFAACDDDEPPPSSDLAELSDQADADADALPELELQPDTELDQSVVDQSDLDQSELDLEPDDNDDQDELPPWQACNQGGHFIARIQGQVVDASGAPLAEARAQPCLRKEDDQLVCLRPEPTTADGHFVQSFDGLCVKQVTMRVMQPGQPRVTVYCNVDTPADNVLLDLDTPFVLHLATPPAALPPEGNPDAERQVDFASGARLDIVPTRLYTTTGGYDDLADLWLPASAQGLCFVEDTGVVSLFGFYPEADVDGQGYTFTLPNKTGLAANSAVDFYLLGG